MISSKEKIEVTAAVASVTVNSISAEDVDAMPVPELPGAASRSDKFQSRNNRRLGSSPIAFKPLPINLRDKTAIPNEQAFERLRVDQQIKQKSSDRKSFRERSNGSARFGASRNTDGADSRAEGTRAKDVRSEQVLPSPYPKKQQTRREKVSVPKSKSHDHREAAFSRRQDERNTASSKRPNGSNGISFPKRKENVNKYAETLSKDELSLLRRSPDRHPFPNRRRDSSEGEAAGSREVSDHRQSLKRDGKNESDANDMRKEAERVDSNEVSMTKSDVRDKTDNDVREQIRISTKKTQASKDSVYSWIVDSNSSQSTEKTKFTPRNSFQKKFSSKVAEKSESVTEASGSIKPRYELYQRNKENILSRKPTPPTGPDDSSKRINITLRYNF